MTKIKLFYILFLLINISTFSQSEDLKDINIQVWQNFTKAYEMLDYNLFASLHSEDLVRVSGNSKTIKDKITYINSYKKWWKTKDKQQSISFRFLERIVNNDKASERGIYKLTTNPNTENEKNHYGKFHVIHIKENGIWKILVDYDSSENEAINETSYLEAFAIGDFEKY